MKVRIRINSIYLIGADLQNEILVQIFKKLGTVKKMYLKKFEVKVASSILNGPLGVASIR